MLPTQPHDDYDYGSGDYYYYYDNHYPVDDEDAHMSGSGSGDDDGGDERQCRLPLIVFTNGHQGRIKTKLGLMLRCTQGLLS